MITIEDFQKLDIRIGTITNAERLEESKKLVKLTVAFAPANSEQSDDFGDESRTILAGIGKTIEDVETLKGKQAPFLVNLEPKELAGVMSEGMILCASSGDSPVMLAPVTEVKTGSKIS